MNLTPKRSASILFQTVILAAYFVFFTPLAHAFIDVNSNGVSDLWEKRYNSGNLFTSFNPLADSDGDGWSNATEAAAGTNPFDSQPPAGFLSPKATFYPAIYYTDPETNITETDVPATITLKWSTLPGKQYTLLYSTDLAQGNWTPLGEPRIGTGSEIGTGIPLTQEDGSTPDKFFWRVAISDPVPALDSDSDGLSNYEEYLAGTDPVIYDSDGDTLSDYGELIAGTNPRNRDEDGDGLTDPFEIAAGTSSSNQDSDGDATPDSLDTQPLLSAQAFADVDGDGIPDDTDPDDVNPRGPRPSITSENASGNPLSNVVTGENFRFIITVSNPAGPVPSASNLAVFLNGKDGAATITAIAEPVGTTGSPSTKRFLLTWDAKVTTGYPSQTLQNISLRFKDSQDATTWLNLARIDVAEWEGMIAGTSLSGLNSGNRFSLEIKSHQRGVKQAAQDLVGGRAIWYRGPKTISLLTPSGVDTGVTAQIGTKRYPLFMISKSESSFAVEQTFDISDPLAFPHHGWFYANRTSSVITMSPATVGSIQVPAGGIAFQPFPPAPAIGSPNIGIVGTSSINGLVSTVYSAAWELTDDSGSSRHFPGLKFMNRSDPTDLFPDTDGLSNLNAGIGATITPYSAGTLENPGVPLNSTNFPPAPYENRSDRVSLLPIQPEQWHKLLLKVGPDVGALSDGINLKLGTGVEGAGAPQSGFSLQVQTSSGFAPLTLTDGKIEMLPSSELYQKLTSTGGLTLFLKRDATANEFHRLGLDLIPKRSTFTIYRIAALDLLPVEVSWKAIDGFDNVDDHIDPWNKPIYGKRIFPEFKNPDDTEIRHKLEVIVKTSPALFGKTVYVKSFDVDDSTSEDFDLDENGTAPVIDTNGKVGNDNLVDYLSTPQNGQFWTGSAWGGQTAQGTVDANGETKFIFRVGMQPGSNYRVVASVIDEAMYAGVQTSDPAAAKYLGPEVSQTGGAAASPLLTVWRRLWVENDSMGEIGTYPGGDLKNDLTSDMGSPTIQQVFAANDITTFYIPSISDGTSFTTLQNGTLKFPGTGDSYTPSNTIHNISSGVDAIQVAGNRGHIQPEATFRLYDDDGFGLGGSVLPRNDLVDDRVKGVYRPAFIEVMDGNPWNDDKTVDFYRSHAPVIGPLVIGGLLGIHSYGVLDDSLDAKLEGSENLWCASVMVAYQPGGGDCDPNDEEFGVIAGVTIGDSPEIAGVTLGFLGKARVSIVYSEVVRDLIDDPLRSGGSTAQEYEQRLRLTAAHEIGHQPLYGIGEAAQHAEDGLMQDGGHMDLGAQDTQFKAKSIKRFRQIREWRQKE